MIFFTRRFYIMEKDNTNQDDTGTHAQRDRFYHENGYSKIAVSSLGFPLDVIVPELMEKKQGANQFSIYCIITENDIEYLSTIGIQHVYVLKNTKIPILLSKTKTNATQAQNEKKASTEVQHKSDPARMKPTSLADELLKSHAFYKKSFLKIRDSLDMTRSQGILPIEEINLVVNDITESVSRNPNALLCMRGLQRADEYTYYHSINVSILASIFAKFLGYSQEEVWKIGYAGMLHDIGKQKIPLDVLNAPRKLTDQEFEILKLHPELTLSILDKAKDLPDGVLEAATGHHEKYDGSGYPHGLKGDQIHPYAAIVSLADVYDALTSDRSYKRAFPQNKTAAIIYSQRGTSFSADMVDSFIRCFGVYPIGSLLRLSNGKYAIVYENNSEGLLHPKVLQLTSDLDKFMPQNVHPIDLSKFKDEIKILSCENINNHKINLQKILANFKGF